MNGSNQSIILTDTARAKLKRFSQQLNVSRSELVNFLINELELMTVGNKFEEQKRLLELDSGLMEKYFGKWSTTTDLNWQTILNNLRGE